MIVHCEGGGCKGVGRAGEMTEIFELLEFEHWLLVLELR